MFDLSQRRALVTGAGQNVGAGIARSLASQGAQVVVNDLDAERAEATAAAICAAGGAATTAVFDVTDLAAVDAAVAAMEHVDILVNNAGNAGAQRLEVASFVDMEPEQWDGPIKVNLYGVLNCCRATVPGMVDRAWGRVITISSGAGTGGVNIGVSAYSGEGGGIAFTRTLALEVARSGVTANSLAIGLMGMPDRTVTEWTCPKRPGRSHGYARRHRCRVRLAGLRRSRLGDRPDHPDQRRVNHHMIVDVDSHWESSISPTGEHPLAPWCEAIADTASTARVRHRRRPAVRRSRRIGVRQPAELLPGTRRGARSGPAGRRCCTRCTSPRPRERVEWMDRVGIDHCLVNPGGVLAAAASSSVPTDRTACAAATTS